MKEIFLYFIKIGFLGFGGPMAHIAMMDEELVEKRKWLSKEGFLEGIAICNMLPGPASTQLGIYMGYVKGGLWGGIIAGTAFIFPAFIIMVALSYLYFNYGTYPQIQGILYGINPLVIALISISLIKMARKSIADHAGVIILIVSACLVYFFNFNTILVMLLAGLVGITIYHLPKGGNRAYAIALLLPLHSSLTRLFTFFLKVGSFIYGGGLVIIPFIEQEVVQRLGWLTQQEFLAGIALGEVTPGPVVITSAFIGYGVYSFLGAAVATLAIFLPSFVFILAAAPYLKKLKDIRWIKAFLKGVNGAVIGTILAASLKLIPNALVDLWTVLIALGGFVALMKYKANILFSVSISGILGVVITYLIK